MDLPAILEDALQRNSGVTLTLQQLRELAAYQEAIIEEKNRLVRENWELRKKLDR